MINYIVIVLICTKITSVINVNIDLDITVCQDYSALIYSDNNNYYKLVDVIHKATVTLLCRFCEDTDVNYRSKTWFYKQRGTDNNNIRQLVSSHKTLEVTSNNFQIKDFNKNDSGIYICKYSDTYREGRFTYVLDEIFDNKIITEVGPINKWQRYQRKIIDPISNKIKKSLAEPFHSFRRDYRFSFNIITFWEKWGPCEPTSWRRGLRKKLAKCRLHPIPKKKSHETFEALTLYFLKDGYDVSCRSVTLNDMLPEISKITRDIPEYEAIESCDPNEPITNTADRENSKNRIIKQIAEKGHVTLVCPEVTTDTNIEWFKNNELLNSSYRYNMAKSEEEPHLTIDSYNSLFILNATKNEQGSYKCKAEGETVQIYEIKVISKSSLINREFIRYSIYLGFILSLTVTCYCAGICVAWHKRASFVDHRNVYQIRSRK